MVIQAGIKSAAGCTPDVRRVVSSSCVVSGMINTFFCSDDFIKKLKHPCCCVIRHLHCSMKASHSASLTIPRVRENHLALSIIKFTQAVHSAPFSDQRHTNCNKMGLNVRKTEILPESVRG